MRDSASDYDATHRTVFEKSNPVPLYAEVAAMFVNEEEEEESDANVV